MTHSQPDTATAQEEVISLLEDPASYAHRPSSVEVIETHGALVFLAGEDVFKIKRAVAFDYMDFSTLAKRKAVCERELSLNQPNAPDLYLNVVPITREADGRLAISGSGTPMEWAIHMRRFSQDDLYSALARRRKIDDGMIKDLAASVAEYHMNLAPQATQDGTGPVGDIITELRVVFAQLEDFIPPDTADAYLKAAEKRLADVSPILDARAASGLIRRCHGDLHLGNIVQWNGKPVLFDALEFDEALATTDLLYEMAFLVMDLWHEGLRAEANLLLNRYLFETAKLDQPYGLSALGLFMAIRAGIRAMVTAQRASLVASDEADGSQDAETYLNDGLGFLTPHPPRLVAVGGLSGTGKSTLAAEIAVHIGSVPGAIHIRSDLERKLLFGAGETERLGAACYTPEANKRVYGAVLAKASQVLKAGQAVVVDAVFSDGTWRGKAKQVAEDLEVPFTGLWLDAPPETLISRVNARQGDASDATADVVRLQLAKDVSAQSWHQIDAGGSPLETVIAADLALRQENALRFDEAFAQKSAAG
ncbi:MAG: AAA family ATPase [Pseudomonadota bacterium]